MENKTEKFLDLYRELEFFGRNTYFPDAPENENIIGRLIALPQLTKSKEDLNYCRVVRNFLTHNPKVGGSYSVEPSDEMIEFLAKVIDLIMVPLKALDVCTRRRDMLSVNTDDRILATFTKMREKNYTHAPVFHKNKFLGILSEASIISYLMLHRSCEITEETKISYISSVIDHSQESSNARLLFIDENTRFDNIKTVFEYNYKKGQPFHAAFITQNGKWNETILGMITPYDLLEHLSG